MGFTPFITVPSTTIRMAAMRFDNEIYLDCSGIVTIKDVREAAGKVEEGECENLMDAIKDSLAGADVSEVSGRAMYEDTTPSGAVIFGNSLFLGGIFAIKYADFEKELCATYYNGSEFCDYKVDESYAFEVDTKNAEFVEEKNGEICYYIPMDNKYILIKIKDDEECIETKEIETIETYTRLRELAGVIGVDAKEIEAERGFSNLFATTNGKMYKVLTNAEADELLTDLDEYETHLYFEDSETIKTENYCIYRMS